MAALVIWGTIIAVILAIFFSYRKIRKDKLYSERLDELCKENIIVADKVINELHINKKENTK